MCCLNFEHALSNDYFSLEAKKCFVLLILESYVTLLDMQKKKEAIG